MCVSERKCVCVEWGGGVGVKCFRQMNKKTEEFLFCCVCAKERDRGGGRGGGEGKEEGRKNEEKKSGRARGKRKEGIKGKEMEGE